MYRLKTLFGFILAFLFLTGDVFAQDDEGEGEGEATAESEEPALSVGGYIRAQSGIFAPMISDGFKPQKDKAVEMKPVDNMITGETTWEEYGTCDPVKTPNKPCYPKNHGQKPGTLSMARSVLLLEGEWRVNPKTRLRAILRGVRSLMLNADEEAAGLPKPELSVNARREYSEEWVQQNVYNEFDLREFFLDTQPFDWLSLRIGRQQISWGEVGQYRLLDVVNPINSTWHFASLESFEDTRIPLWMAKASIDMESIGQSLELVWAPLFLDRPEDTVTTSLGFVGAWGVPYSNTPTAYVTRKRTYEYPGGRPKDMRAGARWKGELSSNMSFSLAYFYTHQLSPGIPLFWDQNWGDSKINEQAVIGFPRQHIAGFSWEYAFESPIAMVARVEAAIEPDRTFPTFSDDRGFAVDPDPAFESPKTANVKRFRFFSHKEMAINYAVVLSRPTMIRFLNPTQNFLLVLQWMHTILPGLSAEDKKTWITIPSYMETFVQTHEMRLVGVISTNYMNGFITPTLVGVYTLPDTNGDMDGYYNLSVSFRFGEYWRMKVALTDFFGSDPYKGIGMFRDRDEVNLSLTCLF